jgi:sulfide:quinone oxidoreductase
MTATAGSQHAARPRALVLGGGFAGVEAAAGLAASGQYAVTLVSDRKYLYLNPISVWIPTRAIEPEKARVPLAAIARRRGFDLLVERVEEIRTSDNIVRTDAGEHAYDRLVIAMGAAKLQPTGVEHTLSICGVPASALDIRDRLDALIARGSGRIAVGFGGNPKDRSAVRGGPAFELLFNIDHRLRKLGLRDRFELSFFAPMAEPGERMGRKALGLLDSMLGRQGIPRRTGTPIAAFDEQGVAFTDGSRLDADLVLFIPGVAGHPVIGRSDLPVNEAGFVRIDDHGLVEGATDVYAVGDVAALQGPEWSAKQGHTAEVMARNAVANILAADTGRPERRGYRKHLSIMCLMDTGNGAALVYRGHTRNVVIPMPVVGHWMKQGWGAYARLTKIGRLPRVPGL